MSGVKFAVVGDTFVDVVAGTLAPDQLPKWGGDVECSRPIELQPGGSALNTATHLANLAQGHALGDRMSVALHTVVGIRRGLCSLKFELFAHCWGLCDVCIGTDSFADVVRGHLAKRGVSLHSPVVEGTPTGVCIVLSGTVRPEKEVDITAAHSWAHWLWVYAGGPKLPDALRSGAQVQR